VTAISSSAKSTSSDHTICRCAVGRAGIHDVRAAAGATWLLRRGAGRALRHMDAVVDRWPVVDSLGSSLERAETRLFDGGSTGVEGLRSGGG
jgi:hypothetical protein